MWEELERLDASLRGLRLGSRAFWTVCAVPATALVLYLGLLDVPRLWRLSNGGVRVDGRVVGTPCAGGTRRFSYRFDIGARTIQGLGGVRSLGLDCTALAAGTVVPVYYLPTEPAVSEATADPRRSLRRRALLVAAIGLLTALGVAGVLVAVNGSSRSRTV